MSFVWTDEDRLTRLIPGDRGREPHCHWPNRQARRLAMLPFTVKLRHERLADFEGQDLLLLSGDAALRCHPLAPDQSHWRAAWKSLSALQDDDVLTPRPAVESVENGRTRLTGDQTDPHAPGQARHTEPCVC